MNRNNDISKVLVTSGDQDIVAAGAALSTLALGQIGIFDENTKLAVDETTTLIPRSMFIAVGVDNDGDAVLDDLDFSAGQYIQTKNTKLMSFRPHTASQNQIVNITDYVDADCDADYSVKFEFRNQEIYRRQGFNQFTKTFSVRTACCIGTETDQDANDLSILLANAINADETGIFSATIIARQAVTIATHGTAANYATGDVITDADVLAMIVWNDANVGSEVYSDIQITLSSLAVNTFCNVNLKYYHPRQTIVIASVQEDLTCLGGTVVEEQAVAFEEGNGYDIQQKEYHSQLNSVGPYILSEATGTAKDNIFHAVKSEEYDQTIIEYDFDSASGWKGYSSVLSTIIAVPATDTVTRNALVAALDVLFAGLGFDTLASDVAAADVDPSVIEATEDKGVADDGIA